MVGVTRSVGWIRLVGGSPTQSTEWCPANAIRAARTSSTRWRQSLRSLATEVASEARSGTPATGRVRCSRSTCCDRSQCAFAVTERSFGPRARHLRRRAAPYGGGPCIGTVPTERSGRRHGVRGQREYCDLQCHADDVDVGAMASGGEVLANGWIVAH